MSHDSPYVRLVNGVSVFVLLMAAVGQAGAQEVPTLPAPAIVPSPPVPPEALRLTDLIQLTLERNPRLAEAAFTIDAARGRAVQAGLYPNPTVSVNLDELGDRTGPGGVNTLPLVSQEIVTAHKLGLNRDAATREVDQAALALVAERYGRFTAVRQSYFEVLTLLRRAEILDDLLKIAEQSVAATEKLLEAKQVARLDLLQLEVERERFRAD